MSRASQRLRKNSDCNSPLVQKNGLTSTKKKTKSAKKVRKTMDLICFDISTEENISEECVVYEKKQVLYSGKDTENEEPTHGITKKGKKVRKAKDLVCIDSPDQAENESTGLEIILQEKKQLLTCAKGFEEPDKCKRKIAKAKRHLKRENIGPKIEMTPKVGEKSENVKPWLITKELSDDDVFEPPRDTENKDESNIAEMVVTTLPSPISPSSESATYANISPLHFNSSKENLRPSTNGTVEPASKRHTYELEDSVIDLDLLKSVSSRDSTRINSFPSSEDSLEFTTPNPSKVTVRRKWNKINDSSFQTNDSPKWLSASLKKLPKDNTEVTSWPSFGTTLEKRKTPEKAFRKSASEKKQVSKVRIPNFAAIHRRALEKAESILEYKQRKENRAKMLLSGQKPTVLETVTTKEKESRKQLRFAPGTADKIKSSNFIPLPSTPLPKRPIRGSSESPRTPKVKFHDIRKSLTVQKENRFKFTPVPMKTTETFKFGKIPVFQGNKFKFESKPLKNFNFNSQPPKVKLMETKQVKQIIMKSKSEKDGLDSRRCAIKGVRSNRRFELLMNMRKGK